MSIVHERNGDEPVNAKTKQRLIVVTGIIVIALIVVLAVVGGGTAAKEISLKDAASGAYDNQRIKVSGSVVPDSYTMTEDMVRFSIYDAEAAEGSGEAATLDVVYEGGVSATFGNDVTAICTGKIGDDGLLACSELVTKCPSKYETATEALSVARLLDYGEQILGKTVKVVGTVVPHTQRAAGEGDRFAIADADDASIELPVIFDGALSEETLADGAAVVITGDMLPEGKFSATNVALEG